MSCSLVCVSHTSFQLSPSSSAGGGRREQGASGISSASVISPLFDLLLLSYFCLTDLYLNFQFIKENGCFVGLILIYISDLKSPRLFGIFGRFIRICFRGLPYKGSMCGISDLCAEIFSSLYAQLISNLVALACKRTALHGIFCWCNSILQPRFITRDCLLP